MIHFCVTYKWRMAINPEEGFDEHDRFQQKELQATLMQGLSSLPQPKNDFEIVVPEDEDLNEVCSCR